MADRPTTLLGAITMSARMRGAAIDLEGLEHDAEAYDLIESGLAELSVGESGEAILAGHDSADRPYRVRLVDVYAHELEASRD